MQGCPADGFQDMGATPGPGLGRPPSQVDIDDSFYSFVGCRCEAGYDNVYTVDNAGTPHKLLSEHATDRLLRARLIVCILDPPD